MADIYSIFHSNFKDYKSSLKQTSLDNENNQYLCFNEENIVYDFDKITKELYPEKQPSSYDALLFQKENNRVFCIEFKNQKYSDINRDEIRKKLTNSKESIDSIFIKYNIKREDYQFIFCVVYNSKLDRWKRGIAKNEIQFELESYMPEYYDDIKTNDIDFLKKEFIKEFGKSCGCMIK
ncbi:MAG: hypothetical protein QM490_05715 [Candidatus Gracilibacteria bacterium]